MNFKIKRFLFFIVIFFITVIAVVLRLIKLQSIPDEIDWDITVSFLQILFGNGYLGGEYFWDKPLTNIFYIIFSKVLGVNRYAILVPNVLIGILFFIPVYILVKKIYSKYIATSTLFWISISSWCILNSRTGYIEIIMVNVLLTFMIYFLYRAIDENKPSFFTLIGLFFGIGLFNGYPSLVYIFPLLMAFFIIWSGKYKYLVSKYLWLGLLLGIVFYLISSAIFGLVQHESPFIVPVRTYEHFIRRYMSDVDPQKTINIFRVSKRCGEMLIKLFYKMPEIFHLGIFRVFNRPLLPPFVSILFIIGIFRLMFFEKSYRSKLLILWGIIPILAFGLISYPEERYLFIIVPVPFIIASFLIIRLLKWIKSKGKFLFNVGFLIVTVGIIHSFIFELESYFRYYADSYYMVTGYADACRFIDGNFSPQDVVIFTNKTPYFSPEFHLFFYSKKRDWQIRGVGTIEEWRRINYLVDEGIKGREAVILVLWNPELDILECIRNNFPHLESICHFNKKNDTWLIYEIKGPIVLFCGENHRVLYERKFDIKNEGYYTLIARLSRKYKSKGARIGIETIGLDKNSFCRAWRLSPSYARYKYFFDIYGQLVLDIIFDGSAKEDEFIQMRREGLMVDLVEYPVFSLLYRIDYPDIQFIDFVFGIDLNGDNIVDEHYRGVHAYGDGLLTEFNLNIYDILKDRHPRANCYRLIELEIYPHKKYEVDCTDFKKGRYRFHLNHVAFYKLNYKEVVEYKKRVDFEYKENQSGNDFISFPKGISNKYDSIIISFTKNILSLDKIGLAIEFELGGKGRKVIDLGYFYPTETNLEIKVPLKDILKRLFYTYDDYFVNGIYLKQIPIRYNGLIENIYSIRDLDISGLKYFTRAIYIDNYRLPPLDIKTDEEFIYFILNKEFYLDIGKHKISFLYRKDILSIDWLILTSEEK